MVNAFYVIIYLVLILTAGVFPLAALAGKTSDFEIVGMGFGLGMIINYGTFFACSVAGILASRIIILTILALVSLTAGLVNRKGLFILTNSLIERTKTLDRKALLIISVVLGGILIWLFWFNISEGFWYGDEFSFWGKAIRTIYNIRSLRIQNYVIVDFSGYPLFWPANAAGIAFMTRGVVENYLKIINVPIMASLGIFVFGYLERLRFNFREKAVSLALLFTSGYMMVLFTALVYADLTFLYLFTMGSFLLLAFLSEKEVTWEKWLGIIFLLAAALTRVNGIILSFITIFSVFLFLPGKRERYRDVVAGASLLVISQLVWTWFVGLSGTERAIPYSNQIFEHFKTLFPGAFIVVWKMLQSLFLPDPLIDGWGFTWWLCSIALIYGIIVYGTREIRAISLTVFLNFAFLFCAYLFVFRREEMLVIASFPRYVLGFTPIALLGAAHVYKLVKEANVKKK